MYRNGITIITLLFTVPLCAQQMSSKYYEENPEENIRWELDTSDTLFYRLPLAGSETLLERESRYGFSFVNHSHRASEPRHERYFLNGLELSSAFDRYPDYSLVSLLRRVQPYYSVANAGTGAQFGTMSDASMETYSVRASDMREGHRLRLQYAERNYRGSVTFSSAGRLAGKTDYAINVAGRAGRDRFVRGVFTEAANASLDLEHHFSDGNNLSVFLLAAPSLRGMRSWAVQETFDLTADNLYNPSWGFYDGRERSSNVRKEFTGLSALTYDFAPIDNTILSVSAMYRSGYRSRSGFTWFDALSPLPDTYAYLPSSYTDETVGQEVADAWRHGDERYTQVGWDEMWYQNSMGDGRAVYVLDDRVEHKSDYQIALTGTSRSPAGVENAYGIRYRNDSSRYYKRVDDMLGGEWIYDIDQYLIDDVEYGDKFHNDMNRPDRMVHQGDEFGYNYTMQRRALNVYDNMTRIKERWRFDLGGELSFVSLQRLGHFRKETVADGYQGRSHKISMTTYSLRAAVRYALSANGSVALSAFAAEYEPSYDDIFLAPQASNQMADKVVNTSVYGMDARLALKARGVSFDFSAYWNRTDNANDIMRYYDDALGVYCDMTLSDVGTQNSGVEAGMEVEVSSRLSFTVAAAYNSYKYTTNPRVDIYRDVDGELLLKDGTSRMKGLVSGQSPQKLFLLGASYDLFGSWWINVDYSCTAGRYATVSALRRTDRMLSMASSQEEADNWHAQEELPAAGNLDVSLYHKFRLGGSSLALSVAVRNLLDRRDTVYGSYEQMRFKKTRTSTTTYYKPYGNKCCYAYPRNCYITLTYEF